MASPIAGRSGRLYVGLASSTAAAEPITNLNKFAFDRAVDKIEVTVFGDSNKTYVTGLPDASGTFSGFYDSASAQLYTAASDGQARRFYLYPSNTDTTKYWFGTAQFDMSVEVDVAGAVSISGNWAAYTDIIKVG